MISSTDGSDVTAGTCNVAVEIDGAAGTGGTATHIANGKWEYAPIQADTNGDYLTFQFVLSGAITTTIQAYTSFPQSVDNDVLASGATGFAAIDTVVDAILADTADIQPNYATSAALTTAQNDLDIITGASGVNLLTATQASIDAIETDTTTDIPALIATAQADLDTLTGTDGATLATAQALYAPAKAGDNMGTVSSVTGNVDGNVTGSVGSNLELGPAEVNAEVVDVIFTDTDAEPAQGTPGATISIADKIGFLYKAWRNRSTQTATTYSLYNDDATTVDHKATVSDNGTTADKGETATGP